METASPTTGSRNFNLDSPPPQPPAKGGFLPPSPPEGGIGNLANSPQILTMQGLAMVKDAFQLISTGQPDLATILQNTLQDLEQVIAQVMAGNTQPGQPGQQGPQPPPAPPGMQGPPMATPGQTIPGMPPQMQ